MSFLIKLTFNSLQSTSQRLLFGLLFVISIGITKGQELEPRLLTNVPIKTNFLVANYSFSQGNILLDPSIQIEDLDSKLNAFVLGYARSFSLFGLSSKFDAILPSANGFWEGRLDGEYRTREVFGMGDPRLRLSVNFLGAPAISLKDYASYKPKTIAGASIQVFLPLGQYDPDRLINLGGNRFVFKPQVGFSTRRGSWIFETYGSVWVFTTNTDFFGGNVQEQRPLLAVKQHFIYTFKNRMWMSLDVGYAFGGQSRVNGNLTDSRISSMRFGAIIVYPFAKQHSLKLALNKAIRFEQGPDFYNIGLAYQFRWGKI